VSNKRIISILITIFIFIIYSLLTLINKHQSLYYYIINPLFWIILSMITNLLVYQRINNHFKYKTLLTEISLIATLIYTFLFYILGLYSGFGKNPYDTSLLGVLLNLWSLGLVIIAKEYIRYCILIITDKNKRLKIGIIIIFLFTLTEINFTNIDTYFEDYITIIKFITIVLMPLIIRNSIFNYFVFKGGFIPSTIYALLTTAIMWPSPILPNHEWPILFILYNLIPFFTFLTIDFYIGKKEKLLPKRVLDETEPKKWIPNFIFVILLMGFIFGLYGYKPVAIISNSMYPGIKRGDVVIVRISKIDNIYVGDIINFKSKSNNINIIHRVVDKYEVNNRLILTTKGDNNKIEDDDPVFTEQVIGKIVARIPKIGYPSILIKEIFR